MTLSIASLRALVPKEKMKKGFGINDVAAAALLLVVASVTVVVGHLLNGTLNSSLATNLGGVGSAGYNSSGAALFGVTNNLSVGLSTFSSNFNLIATVVVFAIIIGLIYRYYMGGQATSQ